MNRFSCLSVFFVIMFLSACGGDDPPSDAPQNVTVAPGESLVLIDWDVVNGRTYWVFSKEGDSVSLTDNDLIRAKVSPPYLLTGLTNDTQYAIAVTSSTGGSPVGPVSPSTLATPRLLSPSVDWFEGVSLTVNDLRSIAFGGDAYVAAGDAATLFIGAYSYAEDEGVTSWDPPVSLPVDASTNLNAVIFDSVRFVALGDDGSVIKNSSGDITTWEAATAIIGAPVMNSLAVGANVYVAVGNAGAIYTNSTDGATADWTAQTSGTGEDLYSVAFVNDRFIATGANGTLLASSDGFSWVVQTYTSNALRGAAYGAENYVVVGDAGTIVSSADGTSWAVQSIPSTESFRDITFGPDQQFIAVGTTGTLAYSTTGADGSWAISNAGAIDLNSIVPNSVFIAVGAAGANVIGK